MLIPDPLALSQILPKANRPWAPHFVEASKATDLPSCLIAAVCWRESRGSLILTPPTPAGTGDWEFEPDPYHPGKKRRVGEYGHGRGLMQIDDRSHPAFLAQHAMNGTPLWQLPSWNIRYGAEVLRSKMGLFPGNLEAGIAAYNAGEGSVRTALKHGRHPDSCTHNHDYCSEVLSNALAWHRTLIERQECGCVLCDFRPSGPAA